MAQHVHVRINEGIAALANLSADMAQDYLTLVAELVGAELPGCTLDHNADGDSATPPRLAVLAGGLPSVGPEARHARQLARQIVTYARPAIVANAHEHDDAYA